MSILFFMIKIMILPLGFIICNIKQKNMIKHAYNLKKRITSFMYML